MLLSAGAGVEGASGSAFQAYAHPPTHKPLRAVIHHVEEEVGGGQGGEGSSQDVGEGGGYDQALASSLRAPRVRVRFEAPSGASAAASASGDAAAAAAAASSAATPAPMPQTPALQLPQQQSYPQHLQQQYTQQLQGTLGGTPSLPGASGMPPMQQPFAQQQQLPLPKSVLVPVPDPTGRSPFILVPLLSEHGQPVSAPLRQPATPSAASAFTATAAPPPPPPPPPAPLGAEWGYPAPSSLPARSGR